MGLLNPVGNFQACELLHQTMENLDTRSEHFAPAFVVHAITVLDCHPMMVLKDPHSS
jgi:hypothetical protein